VCITLNTLVDVVAVLASARLLRSRAAASGRARLLRTTSGATLIGLGLYVVASRRDA